MVSITMVSRDRNKGRFSIMAARSASPLRKPDTRRKTGKAKAKPAAAKTSKAKASKAKASKAKTSRKKTPVRAATGAGGKSASPLGKLPEWNLGDLYSGPEAPEFKADLAAARTGAESFETRWKGRIALQTVDDRLVR